MIYVSGPMSGFPENNVPLFQRVTAELRARGVQVVCPTECTPAGIDTSKVLSDEDWQRCMRADLSPLIGKCTGIAMLPGWENSKGATWEAMNAMLLKLDYYLVDFAKVGQAKGELIFILREWPRERILAAFMNKWSGSFLG